MNLKYNAPAPAKSGVGVDSPESTGALAPSAKQAFFSCLHSMVGCVRKPQGLPVPCVRSVNLMQSATILIDSIVLAVSKQYTREIVMSERTCKKCGATKPASDFYPLQKTECKECTKKRVRENRAANIDHYREFDRQRANLPHRVEARKEYAETERGKEALNRAKRAYKVRNPEKQEVRNPEKQKEYAKTEQGKSASSRAKRAYISRNPEKRKAHNDVLLALHHGILKPKPCESCGAPRAHAHHDDYSRPLNVRWLCPACHSAHHKAERQKQRVQETA